MLQQTTVATVTPYFEKFLKQWNSLEDLAHAELEDVLLSWAGLGYYTRARNLKRCAETVVSDLGGEFPRTEPELLRLPGIGPYTAAAISAIAFGQKATVVDGNVERVITRLFQIEDPLPKSKPEIGDRAKSLTSPTRPGDYAQAIMDLGATVCRPKSPNCAVCPWVKNCKSAHFGVAEAYPKRMRKKPKPRRSADLLYLLDPEGQVLARKRPDKGLLAQMWEFPSSEWDEKSLSGKPAFDMNEWIGTQESPSPRLLDRTVEHTFTHFHLSLRIWVCQLSRPTDARTGEFLSLAELSQKPLPTVMAKVLKAVGQDLPK